MMKLVDQLLGVLCFLELTERLPGLYPQSTEETSVAVG